MLINIIKRGGFVNFSQRVVISSEARYYDGLIKL